ncbi:hypothetical protein [Bartonella sp. HY406]|uniref:hypothetical protein n=1 Tax=Bartonella sp. HY406 TaxID=2979331 RepID=UPI0021C8338B|nr:hypothetical protein [Bartonella sp. HY406]UXN04887.1 hypothetical protein N6B01_14365 [Bartonella sp. HY406]
MLTGNLFIINVKNHTETLAILELLTKKLNIANIDEHDSSYYLNDTYWNLDQGFWSVKLFYTGCFDCENPEINGKIHLAVVVRSHILTDAELSAISGYLIKILETKHKVIIESEIFPGLCDEEHALLAKFYMQ